MCLVHQSARKRKKKKKRSSQSSRAAMFIMRDEMDVMCCKSVGTDLSMLDIDDLMTEISQLKKEVALLESKLRQRDELNTKDVSGVSLCGFTDQTSTELLVSVCNGEDQKTSVNLLDCGMEVKEEVTEEQIDEGGLIYSDLTEVKQEVTEAKEQTDEDLIVKKESSQLNIMEETPHHFIPKEESQSCLIIEKNLSPEKSNKQKTTTAKDPLVCPQCGKTFSCNSKLKRHMSIHTGEAAHTCAHCEKSFKSKYYLNVHTRRLHTREKPHHGDTPYRCDQCGKSFTSKCYLNLHTRRLHTVVKPHRCDQCGKAYIRKCELTIHMRVHTGGKPYSCDQCGRSFSRKTNLKEHMGTHIAEKPFRCEKCGKSFGRRSYFNVHMRNHTGEKPYSCDQCGKSYIRKSSLNVHMKIHTREKPQM
ncbi:uncharacterized protein [Paramisgurnus dabryanus]|uniref:uncharacterized protein n=1 Tax=Paramisgurnus dabryanus TaxID=90735 RepID=UPI0031F3B97E